MDKNEVYNEIKTLLVKLFELDEDDITLESRLYEDLELDSIDAVDMVVHLQNALAVRFHRKPSNLYVPCRMS